MIEDELVFASRQVQKTDARPGGYRATGEHGGILGTIGQPGPVVVWFRPTTQHTWKSRVRLTALPATVSGVRAAADAPITQVEVAVKDEDGRLRGEAIPKMTMLKVGRYQEDARAIRGCGRGRHSHSHREEPPGTSPSRVRPREPRAVRRNPSWNGKVARARRVQRHAHRAGR